MAYFWDTFYVWFPACVSQAATDREPLSDTFLGHFLWLFLVTFFGYFSFMFDFPACVSQIATDREPPLPLFSGNWSPVTRKHRDSKWLKRWEFRSSKVRVRFQKLSFNWEGDMLTKCYVNGFDIVVQHICNFMLWIRPFSINFCKIVLQRAICDSPFWSPDPPIQ